MVDCKRWLGASKALIVALGINVSVGPSHAQSQYTLTLKDLEALDPLDMTLALSPDGQTLAIGDKNSTMTLVDVHSGRTVNELGSGILPTWSPKGDQVAFYSTRSGDLQLWRWDRAGNALVQLTEFPNGIDPNPLTKTGWVHDAFLFNWSPDGTRIVFASRTHRPRTSEDVQAHGEQSAESKNANAPLVMTAKSPFGRSLAGVFTQQAADTGEGVYESRDGHSFQIRPRQPKENPFGQLYVLDIANRALKQITNGAQTFFQPTWSPDGTRIASAAMASEHFSPDEFATDIVVIDEDSGTQTVLVNGPTRKFRPEWSSDGSKVAYLMSTTLVSVPRLFVVSIGDGKSTEISSSHERSGAVWRYSWDKRNDSFTVAWSDQVSTWLGRIAPSTGSVQKFARLAVPLKIATSASGAVAWVENDSRRLPTIRYLSPGMQEPKLVRELYPTALTPAIGKLEVVKWRNGRGDELKATMLLPPSFQQGRRYPLIVDAYPLTPREWPWSHPMSGNYAWASMGYVVFRPSAPAPHVWTQEGGVRAKGAAGWDVTVDDVMSGIDVLISRGIVDSDRICLYGHSNGGGVVNYLVTRTNRFRCAVSVAATFSNWVRPILLGNDQYRYIAALADGKTLENHLDEFVALSAVFHLSRVDTPMLLAVGDKDFGDILLNQIEMYNGLRRLGKDVTLIRYPDQRHIFEGEALQDFWQREMAFFGKYLKPPRQD